MPATLSAVYFALKEIYPQQSYGNRLKDAHVIITPSIVDNFPYAVVEAMALGENYTGFKK